ncbi:MAG: sulfatase [Planctomycetia bacterium]|nr:sulfatase [Planctomycetia bacterium]
MRRFALIVFVCFVVCPSLPAAERPNVLWISIEDTSPDLGCYGDKYAVTPNLDRLASQGCRYTNCFTHAGVCAPSRSGIITGMYPTSMGTQFMRCRGVPPTGVKCFTEYLRAAGYYCTNDNKTDYNFDPPLTAWDDSRRGAHWRNRPSKDTPFFAVINLTQSHESQVRLPETELEARRKTLAPNELHDPAKAPLPPYYPDTPVVRRDMANLYDNVTFVDKLIGEILKDLEDDGLAGNTIVFFWGDHGRGLPRSKRWIYDSGTHTPLIIRWPGKLTPGSVNEELVAFIDFAPTLLNLAGVEIPRYMQGRAFLGENLKQQRQYVYAARDRMDEAIDIIRGVRDKRYHYIRNYRPDLPYAQHISYMDEMPTMKEWRRLAAAGELKGPQAIFFQSTKPVEELYDAQTDPHEVKNLAGDPSFAKILAELRNAHEKWREETGDVGLIPEAELNEQRRPGGKWSVTADPTMTPQSGKIGIECQTEGASITYRTGKNLPAGEAGHWNLYTKPIEIAAGESIQCKACRLGYRDSQIVSRAMP